jgi:hypothetical protein
MVGVRRRGMDWRASQPAVKSVYVAEAWFVVRKIGGVWDGRPD